ncbi:50S ribosomal protein L16 [Candidatus Dependentiae bacterium Noda2021]|nr:50S ribosomal protein L16 [Candidatus Dependentiae bacterium Noda2021]
MLMPKKTKFRKMQKGTMKGRSKGARDVSFGEFGLEALEPKWLTAQQIESMRITISRKLKKVGRLYLRVFPDKPVTKKPAETRMGKGKGNPELWVSVVKRGRVICEIAGLSENEAREALQAAAYKLPLRTKFVRKDAQQQVSVE